MFLGRIIRLIQAEHHTLIRVSLLTKIFVFGDVVSFAAQTIGAVMLIQQSEGSYERGRHIIRIGLAVQVIFFVLFLITAVRFHFRTNRHPTDRSRHPEIAWKRHMYVLYTASVIILLRCIYRFVEYQMEKEGEHGYLLANEWPTYVLDSVLMLGVMVLFFVLHPSQVTALRHAQGRVAMRLLSGQQVGPLDDHWRKLPEPTLGPRVYYEAGDHVRRMTRHPPMGAQMAQANSFRR